MVTGLPRSAIDSRQVMKNVVEIETVAATRYVTPLREGGSMPGLMEADDDGLHVVKYRAAGQGTLALAAELISFGLAQQLGVRTPKLTFVEVDSGLGLAEPDPEIQELIVASPGLNLGSDFLPGARTYSPADQWQPAPDEAAAIVWFDALILNVDRAARNPNLLIWHDALWAIDHGAALFRQHGGLDLATAAGAFPQIAEHVLLPRASAIEDADRRLAGLLDRGAVERAVELVPESWFTASPAEQYVDYLCARLEHSRDFSQEADLARP